MSEKHTAACWAMPECATCRMRKKPHGRSAPFARRRHCDHECPGYDAEPRAGHFWPDEEPELRAAIEETMKLCREIDRLRKVCADAAADLVRECRAKGVDTMWHGNGCTLWELLNMNGAELEEPVESPPID